MGSLATSPHLAPSPRWLAALHEEVLALELQIADLQPAIKAIAAALSAAGFAPARVSVSILTIHPALAGLGYVWSRATGSVAFFERPWGFLDTDEHRGSPLHTVMTTGAALALSGAALGEASPYALVREFARSGATTYLALPVRAARGDVHVFALWTDRAGGWSAADVDAISRVVPLLTLLVEVTESRRLLGVVGAAQEVTQRALAEQALRNADALVRQQAADMERLERERRARLETERQLEQRTRDLAERNDELVRLAASLEEKVSARTSALQDALVRVQAATQAKSRFLAMISHEIRTPMHGVLGLSELLSKTALDDDQRRYLSNVQSTGQGLLAIINDILDFSKIEADRLELEALPVDPRTHLAEVAALLRGQAEAKGIFLDAHCEADVPALVEADPTRLRQIWMNLLGNAVKFTERGVVLATLEVARRTPQGVTLRGQVRDTGVGISRDAQERLFEPFSQADSSTARRFGGSGLGLAICSLLVQKMGGALTVESEEGVGSVFTFELSVRAPEPREAEAAPRARPEEVDVAAMRVLLVDDNPVNRLLASGQLKALGNVRARTASSGRDALELLRAEPFDVVLMDMQMPEMDGLEATRRLREIPLAAQPRVIAMTASAFEEDRHACIAAGMDGFLAKPVSLAALRDALREACVAATAR